MPKRWAVVVCGVLAVLAIWWGDATADAQPEERPRLVERSPAAPFSRPAGSATAEVAAEAPEASDAEPAAPYVPTPWSLQNAFWALATRGMEIGPWQSRHHAVEALCDGPSGGNVGDLESWIDTVTWHRDIRGTWAAARRASGPRRLEFVQAAAASEGVADCPLLERLSDDLALGNELPVVPATHGDLKRLAVQDERWLAQLRAVGADG
jgi:hypothetical protein